MVDAMGVTPMEKVKLVTYYLKDVAEVWFEHWMVERPLE